MWIQRESTAWPKPGTVRRNALRAGVAQAGLAVLFIAWTLTAQVNGVLNPDRPLPDTQTFLEEFRGALHRDARLLADYTYSERETQMDLDSSGKTKKTETKTYQVLHGAEDWQTYRRLMSKDGKPLSVKELEKQDREEADRVAKEERKRAGWSDSKRKEEKAKDDRKEQEIIDDIFALYDIRLVRRETIDGRAVILVTYTPKDGFKPKTDEGKMLQHISGRAWIAEDDRQLARLEAETKETISMGAGILARVSKGSTFMFERRKINDEIWLPMRAEFHVSARLLLIKGVNQRQVIEYSDHRKYTVDTVIRAVSDPE
ncbi:MAG TPA: hypothetical protein VFY29_13610 [Terriglobia bacterium]|nr:hypothetical protein [Terriglobia bacterium]